MRRSVLSFSNQLVVDNMRISKTAAVALLGISTSTTTTNQLLCNGFSSLFTTAVKRRSFSIASTSSSGVTTQRFASTLSDQAVETTSSTTPQSLIPTGKPIAEGAIVSYFKGGLAAVRIRDDMTTTTTTPTTKTTSSSSLFSGPPAPMETNKPGSSQGDDLMGKQVVFPNGAVGLVVAQRFPLVFVLSDADHDLQVDGTVSVLDSMACVSVGKGVVDCFGNSLVENSSNTENESSSSKSRAIFSPIPKVSDIGLINSPLLTGTTMVDALAPLGKGQNMLVVGSCMNEMRNFAKTMLDTQLRIGATNEKTTRLVYALTEHNPIVLEELKNMGLMDHEDVTTVSARDLHADSDEAVRAAEATAVAATACAIGEAYALSGEGQDALVIVDSINQHKILWDATTRVMVDVYGVDAVVKADREGGASSEMRAFYSSLIQRAGKFKPSRGDGSMTLAMLTSIPNDDENSSEVYSPEDFEGCSDKIKARLDILVNKNIPLTAATLKKIEIPIPSASEGKRRLVLQHVEDLISMSDGQIWFDETLKNEHQFSPPLHPQRSITRVGIGADTESRADAPAMRRVVGGLRLDLAQALAMDGAEATVASSRQAQKRNAWLLAMHQTLGAGDGRPLSESCVALLAAATGALDEAVQEGKLAGTPEGQAVISNLLQHIKLNAPDAMKKIDDSLDMDTNVRQELEDAIDSFFP